MDRLIVIDHGRKITEGSPRQLIAEHIEPQVIEAFDEASRNLPAFVETNRDLAERVELSGETALLLLPRSTGFAGPIGCRRSCPCYLHRAPPTWKTFSSNRPGANWCD